MEKELTEGKYRRGDLIKYSPPILGVIDFGVVWAVGEQDGERWASIYWSDEPAKSYTIWEGSSYWWNIDIIARGDNDEKPSR